MLLDEMVIELSPGYSQRHEDLFGKGRGRLGSLIYKRMTAQQEIDELDIYVARIRQYLDKSESFLKNKFKRKQDGFFFKKPETPQQYISRATIGFIITERLSFYANTEIRPGTHMKVLNLNEIAVGSLRAALEAKDFSGYMPNQIAVYQKALRKNVSYIIERFADIN